MTQNPRTDDGDVPIHAYRAHLYGLELRYQLTEISRGRVRRHGWGAYGPGSMPGSTRRRVRKRARQRREQL